MTEPVPTGKLIEALRDIAGADEEAADLGYLGCLGASDRIMLREAATRLEDYEIGIELGRQHAKVRRNPFLGPDGKGLG